MVHVAAGGVGLVAGAIALSATKGAPLHRQSGLLFVYAMLTMSLTGAAIAAFAGVPGSVVAGLLAAYLCATALLTVRSRTAFSRRLDIAAMLVALSLAIAAAALGVDTLSLPGGSRDGQPAQIYFVFGTVALLAGLGDTHVVRSGALRGARRLARHLWRMCFALWIATASFFLGQAQVIPKPIRIPGLLVLPVLAVLVIMFYWLWRVGVRKSLRGMVGVGAP